MINDSHQKRLIIPRRHIARVGSSSIEQLEKTISFIAGFDSKLTKQNEFTRLFKGLILRSIDASDERIPATMLMQNDELARQYSEEDLRIARVIGSTCVRNDKDVPVAVSYIFLCDQEWESANEDYVTEVLKKETRGYSSRAVNSARLSLRGVPSGKAQNNASPKTRA